jgi:hypothetical protein
MTNLFLYNIHNIVSITKDTNINLDKVNKTVNSIDTNLTVEKCLGHSYNGTIFLIKNNQTNKKNQINVTKSYSKLICKIIPLFTVINSKYIKSYHELLDYLYDNISIRNYILPILDYKINNNNSVYLIYPHFKGYDLLQTKENMLKLGNTDYNILVKHIIKKLLKGFSDIHLLNIYHNNLSDKCILIKTTTNTKPTYKSIKIKFTNFANQNFKHPQTTTKKKKKKKSKKKSKSKSKKNSNKQDKKSTSNELKKDIKDLGFILLKFILNKQLFKVTNENKTFFRKTIEFLGFGSDNLELELDDDLLEYINIIKTKMIKKQEPLHNVLKDILLHEKYKS